jgi:hypothetical protein
MVIVITICAVLLLACAYIAALFAGNSMQDDTPIDFIIGSTGYIVLALAAVSLVALG